MANAKNMWTWLESLLPYTETWGATATCHYNRHVSYEPSLHLWRGSRKGVQGVRNPRFKDRLCSVFKPSASHAAFVGWNWKYLVSFSILQNRRGEHAPRTSLVDPSFQKFWIRACTCTSSGNSSKWAEVANTPTEFISIKPNCIYLLSKTFPFSR